MKNIIKNIGALDVRNISEELADKLDVVTNCGVIITNEKSRRLMESVSQTNVGQVVISEEELSVINENGHMTLDQAFLESLPGKALLNVNGKMIIKNDVKPETWNEKIISCSINGTVVTPHNLSGTIRGKSNINGKLSTYPCDFAYYKSTVTLDNEFLKSYFGKTRIAVNRLIITDDIEEQCLSSVLEKVYVMRKLVISDKNLEKCRPYLAMDDAIVKVYEAPIKYFDDDLELTESIAQELSASNVVVDGELSCHDHRAINLLMDQSVIAEEIVVLQEGLDTMRRKVKKPSQTIVSFEEKPLKNSGKMTIDKDYLTNQVVGANKTIVNLGALVFSDHLSVSDFDNVSLTIMNYGAVKVPKNLLGFVTSLVTSNKGVIKVKGEAKEKRNEENKVDEHVMYSNMGMLTL